MIPVRLPCLCREGHSVSEWTWPPVEVAMNARGHGRRECSSSPRSARACASCPRWSASSAASRIRAATPWSTVPASERSRSVSRASSVETPSIRAALVAAMEWSRSARSASRLAATIIVSTSAGVHVVRSEDCPSPVSTTTSLSPRWSVPNWPGLPASPVSALRLIGRATGILLIAGVHLVKGAGARGPADAGVASAAPPSDQSPDQGAASGEQHGGEGQDADDERDERQVGDRPGGDRGAEAGDDEVTDQDDARREGGD